MRDWSERLGDQDDPTLTTRVSRPGGVAEESKPAETTAAEPPAATGGIVQQIWRRIKEERNRPKRVEINTRGQNNMDRSKAFLVLGTAVVLCGFAFPRCSLPPAPKNGFRNGARSPV